MGASPSRPGPDTIGSSCQDRVKGRHEGVNGPRSVVLRSLDGDVIENLVAAFLGLALLAYLVYALVRPEKF